MGKAGRIEFSAPVKRQLRQRAGDACSYPTCRRGTSSSTLAGDVLNGGKAAHIIPASGKGPRSKLRTSGVDISSYENGLWLCGYCHDLVDADDGRFSVEVLNSYRERAERWANARAERLPWEPALVPQERSVVIDIVQHDDRLTVGEMTRTSVRQCLDDMGLAEYVGNDVAELVRLFFTELILNACTHGSAEAVSMRATSHIVSLIVSGDDFSLEALRQSSGDSEGGRGGGRSALQLLETIGAGTVIVSNKMNEGGVEVLVAGPGRDGSMQNEPCSVRVGTAISPDDLDLESLRGCEVIHVTLGRDDILSDRGSRAAVVRYALETGAQLVVHCRVEQEVYVRAMFPDLSDDVIRFAR
jgi:hypothetical protein